MNTESLATLDRIIHDAALELFAAYCVPLDPGKPNKSRSGEIYAATIGFTHPVLKGAVIITLGRELIERSLPAELKATPAVDGVNILADWTGELSNQLLGRIKSKMAPYGVEILLSTPVVFWGKGLSLTHQQAIITRVQHFGAQDDHLELVFQTTTDNSIELVEGAGGRGTFLREGEVSFF